MNWKQWAEDAIRMCAERGIDPASDMVVALEEIRRTGYEPYIMLKASVFHAEKRAQEKL